MENQRGLTIHFTDGRKISLVFPPQTSNPTAAQLKLDDVLKNRQLLIEVQGTLLIVPFDNVSYLQVYPAPVAVLGNPYITGASIVD